MTITLLSFWSASSYPSLVPGQCRNSLRLNFGFFASTCFASACGPGNCSKPLLSSWSDFIWFGLPNAPWKTFLSSSQTPSRSFRAHLLTKLKYTVFPLPIKAGRHREHVDGMFEPEFTRISSFPLAKWTSACICFLAHRVPREPEHRSSRETATVVNSGDLSAACSKALFFVKIYRLSFQIQRKRSEMWSSEHVVIWLPFVFLH